MPPQKPIPAKVPLSTSRETYIAILTAAAIAAHLILRYLSHQGPLAHSIPLFAALAVGGIPILVTLGKKLWAREFGSDLLAGISILASVLMGQYLVGAIIVLMLSGGAALEQFATRRASSVLDALAKRMPQIAHRKRGTSVEDVKLDEIWMGDKLIVLPHEICPVDGVVVEGRGIMDESYLTGEPFEISKTPGSKVLSGAINGDTALTIEAEKAGGGLALRQDHAGDGAVAGETPAASPHRGPTGRLVHAPGCGLAGLTWLVTGRLDAISCGSRDCYPLSPHSGDSRCRHWCDFALREARHHHQESGRSGADHHLSHTHFRQDRHVDLRQAESHGPRCAAPGFTRDEVLQAAASLEQFSKHPLAGAVVQAATDAKLALLDVSEMQEKPGEGLSGWWPEEEFGLPGAAKLTLTFLLRCHRSPPDWNVSSLSMTTTRESFRFHDAPRQDTKPFVHHLNPRHQVNRVLLVSGDRESEVRYLAQEVGITEVHAGQTPEQKVAIVEAESKRARTLFIGDGINDAPALMTATVGVAFGPNSDITSEAADAVILLRHSAKWTN